MANSIQETANLHLSYAPGKALDSAALVTETHGDSFLTPAAVKDIQRAPLDEVLDGWNSLAQSDDILVRRLAQRSLLEVELALYAEDQVTGTADMSKEIGILQEQLHEHYDEGLYKSALKRRIETLHNLTLKDAKLMELRRGLLDDLRSIHYGIEAGETEIVEPTKETLSRINEWQQGQFGDIIAAVDTAERDTLNAEDIKRVFDLAIATTPNLRQNNWTATIIDRQKQAISVYTPVTDIVIPRTRTATKEKSKQLAVHEPLGHALRSANAFMAGDPVGTLGTPTYARFEESFFIAGEQCLANKYQPLRGIDHYVAVGLAVTSHQTIDDIASIFYRLHLLSAAVKGDSTKIEAQAKRLATAQVQRTFAGMTDVDPGIANRRDINYLHGLNDSWRLLNFLTEHDLVESGMAWLMAAKFNPFDEDDRAMVEKYHPMPMALKPFFEAA